MRSVLSGLLTRLSYLTLPLLVVADLTRALGERVSLSTLVLAAAVPIIGLVVDIRRVRRSRTAPAGIAATHADDRPPFQFGLRTMFIVMTVVAIYFGVRVSTPVSQKRAIAEMRAVGIPITYDGSIGVPEVLFGREMFGTVSKVTLRSDAEVEKFARLPGIREIMLSGPRVTDASIETLTDLPQLEELTLNTTSMSLEGINRIERSLPNGAVKVYPPH